MHYSFGRLAMRVIDTRTGGEVQIGGTITDHCGHSAKLIEVTGPTMIKAEWLPDGLIGEYSAKAVFSLSIEESGE